MKLSLGTVCRGDGNVYVRVVTDGEGQGYTLKATSVLATGREEPAHVLPCPGLPNNEQVAAVSIFDLAQTLTVTAYDAQGNESAHASKRIRPWIARISSKLASMRSDSWAQTVRGFDALPHKDGASITCDMLIADGKYEILSGSVELSLDEPANATAAYEIVCLNRHGQNIAEKWICMGDALKGDEQQAQPCLRKITFSLRIPAGMKEFTVWAYPCDRESAAWSGFRSVEWFVVDDLRGRWKWRVNVPADRDPDYNRRLISEWRPSVFELEEQRRHTFVWDPLFSIVVPLFRTPLNFFNDMAASVMAQSYANFELILVNASPDAAELTAAANELAERDERVHVIQLGHNLGIAENTNKGVRAATGDFVCFLDHDDMLEPDTLFEYARALNEHDGIDLIYCDEDKTDGLTYGGVYLKPDYSPDLMLGVNYICHFLACRREVLLASGYAAPDLNGAQDYDACFRVIEAGGRVWHVRRVLYHWRVHPGSTAVNEGQKDYAQKAGLLSIQRHLDRCGIAATVRDHPRFIYHYEVEYDLSACPLVSIIIPSKDNIAALKRCLDSIVAETLYSYYEFIIVENNSSDPATFAAYKEMQDSDVRVHVIDASSADGFNFSRLCNAGAAAAHGSRLLFLNNDIEVLEPHWLDYMLGHTMRPGVGAVGAMLLYPDGTIQHAGVVYGWPGPAHLCWREPVDIYDERSTEAQPFDLSIVTGAACMVRRDAFDAIGGFDETFAVDYNDVDLCLRLCAADYSVVFDPRSRLRHDESLTRGDPMLQTDAEIVRFRAEHARLNERWVIYQALGDPFYNPRYNRNVDALYYRM